MSMTLEQVLQAIGPSREPAIARIWTHSTPSPGLVKFVEEEEILLFGDYKQEVERRGGHLLGGGEDRSWGERLEGCPCILAHRDKHYLQGIIQTFGFVRAFIGPTEINPELMPEVFLKNRDGWALSNRQGLPPDKVVFVRTYGLPTIEKIEVDHHN